MLKKSGKVVLVGGCFDVIHLGHVIFLEKAKKEGDRLIILLESDERVRKLKGIKRPVNSQKERARVLLALKPVDRVILLPNIDTESEYDAVVKKIKPDIIAITAGGKSATHHIRAAKLTGAKIKYVTKMIGKYSTSRILGKNFR